VRRGVLRYLIGLVALAAVVVAVLLVLGSSSSRPAIGKVNRAAPAGTQPSLQALGDFNAHPGSAPMGASASRGTT
jgi:hypothetical protein